VDLEHDTFKRAVKQLFVFFCILKTVCCSVPAGEVGIGRRTKATPEAR